MEMKQSTSKYRTVVETFVDTFFKGLANGFLNPEIFWPFNSRG